MKLGTLRSGERDGRLCVVSRDLRRVAAARDIAPTLQAAVENWDAVHQHLRSLYDALNNDALPDAMPFDARSFLAPLPRAYQWIDAGGYMSHMQRMRSARKAPMPVNWETEPAIYQGLSDANLACADPIQGDTSWGIDLEAELAVIVGDVPLGVGQDEAASAIRLLVLVNDISLRRLIPEELGKGFGFFWGKPASAFGPVAVTPDELGDSWREGKAVCKVRSQVNDRLLGEPMAGIDQGFSFPRIIEHATKTRSLTAGSIVGAGTVSNYDPSVGVSCLVERHVLDGTPPSFLEPGDHVSIEAFDRAGNSIFGAIRQQVIELPSSRARR